jgi:hypothetical protein
MHHWPDLHRAVTRRQDLPREFGRLIEAVRLEHVVAARHFGTAGEQTVGDARLVTPSGDADSGR